MATLLGGPYSTLLTRGTKMGNTEMTPSIRRAPHLGTPIRVSAQRHCKEGQLSKTRLAQSVVGGALHLGTPARVLSQMLCKWGQLREALLSRRAPSAGTPARTLRRALVRKNSGALRLCKKGQLGRIHACRGWVRLPFSGSNTRLLAI